jgi:hypothetical protein
LTMSPKGWSPTMQNCWPQKLNKNVWRDNVFEIRYAKVSDKWWRIHFMDKLLGGIRKLEQIPRTQKREGAVTRSSLVRTWEETENLPQNA